MSFQKMKKNSKKTLQELSDKIEKMKGGSKNYDDNRMWVLTRDKAGNGHAVIRFLPCKDGETAPWNSLYNHGFKGPSGQWYIEGCKTTIEQDCIVCTANSALWNSGEEDDKKLASSRKRKLSYYSNILVVDDPANPENNGKVFLFRYGKKVMEKIEAKMSPDESFGDDPMNPFDMFVGANFKLRVKKVAGYPNYDLCDFDQPSPVDKNEKVMEDIYNQLYSLLEFTDPSNFKSDAELESRFNKVVNGNVATSRKTAEDDLDEEEETIPTPIKKSIESSEMEEDDMAFFESLANQ